MKNMFLVIALMFTASFTFASTEVVEINDSPIIQSVLAEKTGTCVSVTLSCGLSTIACGGDLDEIVELVTFMDDLFCSNPMQ